MKTSVRPTVLLSVHVSRFDLLTPTSLFFCPLACVFHHSHLFTFSLPLLTCLRLLSTSAASDCYNEQRDEHTHHSYPGQLRDREPAEGQTTQSSTASNPQIECRVIERQNHIGVRWCHVQQTLLLRDKKQSKTHPPEQEHDRPTADRGRDQRKDQLDHDQRDQEENHKEIRGKAI